MRYDYSGVSDPESFVSVPGGTYPCRIAEVRPGRARDGSEQWSFRLEVLSGDYAGRTAAWDSLTWSERGVVRVKLVLAVFGFDVDGELDIQPQDLEQVSVIAQIQEEAWEDPNTGRRLERMRVPYEGYTALDLLPARTAVEAGVDRMPASRDPGAHGGGSFDDTPF
ncbi:MAG: hypothetical protein GY711_25555 [bacterium]|nr:hypothetical protein [bacterium]